jgi:hypothetical protein
MVYSTVEGKGSETQAYLAGTNKAEFHASLDADGIYEKWAVLEVDGKKYIYNITMTPSLIEVNPDVTDWVGGSTGVPLN